MMFYGVNNYKGKPLQIGVTDCNLMVLEYTGFDLNRLDPYSTIQEAEKSISKSTGCSNTEEYLISIGMEEVDNKLIKDGAVLVKGIHNFIYFNNCLFGLDDQSGVFQWFKCPSKILDKFKVFQWQD